MIYPEALRLELTAVLLVGNLKIGWSIAGFMFFWSIHYSKSVVLYLLNVLTIECSFNNKN